MRLKLFLLFLSSICAQKNDGSSEVEGDRSSVPDKFDQPSYGFMLPEGFNENSTLLAVVDFITQKNHPTPKIAVNFDELNWFDIGGVQKTKADNADVYSATVILKAGSDVRVDKTDQGIYKFVVEAQLEDNVLATTNVVVEVLALAPTTKRARTTEDPIEISNIELTPAENDEDLVLGVGTTIKTATQVTTTTEPIDETTVTEDVKTSTEPSTTSETTSKPFVTDELTTSEKPTETSTQSENSVTTEESITLETTSEPLVEKVTEEVITTSEDLTTKSSTTSISTALDNDSEFLTNIPDESSGTQETPTTTTTQSSDDFLEASATQPSEIESSGELLTDESPVESPITILPLLNHKEIETVDLEIEIQGVPRVLAARVGSQVRGLVITPKSEARNNVTFSIEPEGLEIRPKVLRTGEPAGIFINEKFNGSRKSYEIVGKLQNGAIVRQPLDLEIEIEQSPDKIYELKEYEFAVLESAENGRTIGRIDESDMKIIGDQRRFSLVGNSIILTCSEFENEKCLENSGPRKMYTLMLLPNNGILAPVQITIKVQQKPGNNLRTSDNILRISDNRIIIPFVILTDSNSQPLISGTASRFLGLRKTLDMYQVQVINSAASGKYELEIRSDENSVKKIPVFVENSQSHAHFRKSKYFAKIDSSKIIEGKRISQVELEGVPIDEAKIIIVGGNPGWVTVEGYGGRVKVNSFDGEVYKGKYTLRIGAIDKKTFTILTETELEIEVINGKVRENQKEQDVTAKLVEITFDRENEKNFEISLGEENDDFILSDDSFAINENGKRVNYEPMNIKVNKNVANIQKVDGLRIISFNLINKNTKLIVLIRLVSSPAYLEKQEKLRAKPIYPKELIEVNMPEEMQKGRIVGVFPAVIPTTNQRTKSRIEGSPMNEAFSFDEETGELRIKKVIDYESLPIEQRSFDLKLISGEKDFETEGIVRINVVDIDDNPPLITKEQINTVSLPEDLPAGAKIAEFDVRDPDGSKSFKVNLEGRGSDQYFANITNSGLLSIFLAPNGKLDREIEDSNALIVQVEDMSGNSDRILIPIQIVDVNDNAPSFSRKMYEVEAVENWPKGVVLEKIQANDPDLGPSGKIHFSLEGSPDLLSINETSGLLTLSGDLMGLSRPEPYVIRIIAQDSGTPALNSSAVLNLRVRSKDELMSQPIVEFVNLENRLEVEENIPDSQKIAKIEARVKGSREDGIILEYTLKDLISEKESFQIDKTSGEIFATRPIDYEETQDYTLLVTATNPADPTQTASTIIHLDIINLEDNSPEFPRSATRVFEVPANTSKSTAIGRIVAYDADKKPIFYYIIPSCGSEMASNFTIDHEFGEIVYHPQSSIKNGRIPRRVELCILADSRKDVDLVDVFYDSSAKNMQKITVGIEENENEIEDQKETLIENQKIAQVGDSLQNIEIPIDFNSQEQSYEIETLNFVPATYELGRDMISPEGSVELNKLTGELAATPRILDAPQGVYIGKLKNGQGIRQLHHVKDDRKLKYVLAMERNEFGANMEKLKRQLREAFSSKSMEVYFSDPVRDSKNSSYTSVCFYITKDNAILEDKQMSSLLSNTNQHIDKIHHIFKVVNVDQCTQAKPLQVSNDIPLNTLILISIVAVLILILIALVAYICCVARYRRSLEEKLKTPYYKSPGSQSYAPTTSSHTIGYY